MNEPVPLTYGIAHLGGAYTVCIEDRVVAEGLTSVPFDDPDCPARNAARIVRETCAELTGADPGEPLVLDLKPLCWLVDDEIEASGRRLASHGLAPEQLIELCRHDDPILLAVFAKGGLHAAAQILAGWMTETV